MLESFIKTPYHTYVCRSEDNTKHHIYWYLTTIKWNYIKFDKIISKLQNHEWKLIIPMLYSIRELLISEEKIEFTTNIKKDIEKFNKIKMKLQNLI
jgi:hypothetical protein